MKSSVTFSFNSKAVLENVRTAGKKAIGEATEYILQESNKRVPLDESTLLKSGNTDVEVKTTGVVGSVFYDTPYAAKLHEHPEYNFQNNREGKYLEKTINQEHATVMKYLADNYKKVF